MIINKGKILINKYFILICSAIIVTMVCICAMIVSKADEAPGIKYKSHVAYHGWLNWQSNGTTSGTVGESRRIEAIKIELTGDTKGTVKYSTLVRGEGWQEEVQNGVVSGSEGESKPIDAIKIELEGEIAEKYSVKYRVHIKNRGWLDWVSDGEIAGLGSKQLRLEAIEIKLVSKNKTETKPTPTAEPVTGLSLTNNRGKVTTLTEDEFAMFAAIIFCESGGEKYEGKLAVANVILNRLYSSKYPNTIEGVIREKYQFSPVASGAFDKRISEYKNGQFTQKNHLDSIKAAKEAMGGNNNIGNRNGFMTHAAFSKYASGKANEVLAIGNHTFFSW